MTGQTRITPISLLLRQRVPDAAPVAGAPPAEGDWPGEEPVGLPVARTALAAALAAGLAAHDHEQIWQCLAGFAVLARLAGQAERALLLVGALRHLALDDGLSPHWRTWLTVQREALGQELPPAAQARAWQLGLACDLPAAVALALAGEPGSG